MPADSRHHRNGLIAVVQVLSIPFYPCQGALSNGKRRAGPSHLLIADQIAERVAMLHDCAAAINGKTFESRSKPLLSKR